MTKKLIFLLCFLCSSICLIGQDTFEYFQKVYGEIDENQENISGYALSTIAEMEDGYLSVGFYDDTLNLSSLEVVKFDGLGEIEWQYPIPIEDTILTYFITNFLIKSYDGSFLVASTYRQYDAPFEEDFLLAKLDSNGNYLWHKTYETPTDREIFYGFIATPDTGYLSLGYKRDLIDFENSYRNAYIMKFDKSGEIEWEQEYAWEDRNTRAFSAVSTPDGGYLVGGGLAGGPNSSVRTLLLKLNSLGEIESEHQFVARCSGRIHKNPNGDYLLGSCYENEETGNLELYIMKVNEEYNVYWEKKLELFGEYQIGAFRTLPQINPDGSFAGSVDYINDLGYAEALLVQFDSLANIQWTKRHTTDSTKHCYLRGLKRTRDGGYIWSGYQSSFPQRGWLLKTDCQGNTCSMIGCDSVYVHTDTTTPPLCMPLPLTEPFVCNAQIQDFSILLDSVNIMEVNTYILPTLTDTISVVDPMDSTQNYLSFYLFENSEGVGLSQDSVFEVNQVDTVRFWALAVAQNDVWELEQLVNNDLTVSQIQDFVVENGLCLAISQNYFTLLVQDMESGLIYSDWVDFFRVAPNPAKDKIVLSYQFNPQFDNTKALFSLYQINGQLIRSVPLAINTRAKTLPISDLSSGIYLFAVQVEGNVAVRGKIVVE